MREIYVVDPETFMHTAMFDVYTELVWTYRLSEPGDFTLTLPWSEKADYCLVAGVFLTIRSGKKVGASPSYEMWDIMIVETVEVTTDSDGGSTMKVSGRSLLSILESRISGVSLTPSGMNYDNGGTVSPGQTLINLVKYSIDSASPLSSRAVLPVTIEYSYPLLYSSPLVEETVDLTMKVGTVLERIQEIAEAYDWGFDFYYHPTHYSNSPSLVDDRLDANGNLEFMLGFVVYAGTDKSSRTVFDQKTESLSAMKSVTSIVDYKNAAYVIGKDKVVIVEDSSGPYSSWQRRELLVDASDISGTGTSATNKLNNRGKAALKKQQISKAVDGTVPDVSEYTYGYDFTVGDYVGIRDYAGVISTVRVMEYVMSVTQSGEVGYPTLAKATPPASTSTTPPMQIL